MRAPSPRAAVVAAALLCGGAFMFGEVTCGPDQSRIRRTTTAMQEVREQVEQFVHRHGHAPQLDELPEDLPEDAWGHRLVLQSAATAQAMEVVSAGPDGEPGTDDDLVLVFHCPR